VQTAVILLNLTPSLALQYKSPVQMLAELGPDFTGPIYLGHLRAYGCRAYIYDELKAYSDKFIYRCDISKLVSYERGTYNIFYVHVPSRNKVVRTSNVTFDESRFDTTIDDEYDNEDYDHITIDEPLYHSIASGGEHNTDAEEPQVSPPSSPLPHVQDIDFIDSGIPELSNRYAPSADSDTVVVAQRVQTVHLMEVPQDANIIKGRWVFSVKADANSCPVRFKARWVARGFTQRHGVDYKDTYASVTKPATVKIMLALTAKLNLECKQFDLVTAFLNALIKKFKIYVEMLHSLEDYAEDGTQLV
jgi:hypothetical protein